MCQSKVRLCTLMFLSLFSSLKGGFLEDSFPTSVVEDGFSNTPQLLMKYKYPTENHFVTTEDKYVLCMHRIPRPGGTPVLLMHGILHSSTVWVAMGPLKSLAYLLYDHGYDVWMGNARGNTFSRNHTIFDPSLDKSFWKFSWHEIGYYDLPAMIDYVLQKTDNKKLTYFGHSQGTTAFFVMCATRPAYNSKINSMQALAPVAFMKHIKSPLIAFRNLVPITVIPELLPHSDLLIQLCFRSKLTLDTCVDTFYQIVGKDVEETNATMWPVVFGQLPCGSSTRQIQHYIQLIESDRFCQYDHGPTENMKLYGAKNPPDYNIRNIKAPIGLYYAHNDYLTSVVDVQRLARALPNVVENHLFPYKKWNHMTVVWGINARERAHMRMLQVIKQFE